MDSDVEESEYIGSSGKSFVSRKKLRLMQNISYEPLIHSTTVP